MMEDIFDSMTQQDIDMPTINEEPASYVEDSQDPNSKIMDDLLEKS